MCSHLSWESDDAHTVCDDIHLFTQGIPPPVVFDMFEETLSLCENTLLTLTLHLESLQPTTQTVAAATLVNKWPPNTKVTQKSNLSIAGKSGHKNTSTSSTNRMRAKMMSYSRHFRSTSAAKLSEKRESDTQVMTSLDEVRGERVESRYAWIKVVRWESDSDKYR